MIRWACAAALLFALGAGDVAAQAGDPLRGEAFARTRCGACHAVGPGGGGANPRAPAFRDLHRRYPVDQLAESLAEGIVTGHEGMPAFELSPAQIDDLMAWLRALERR